jgi:hypothetical protein
VDIAGEERAAAGAEIAGRGERGARKGGEHRF